MVNLEHPNVVNFDHRTEALTRLFDRIRKSCSGRSMVKKKSKAGMPFDAAELDLQQKCSKRDG